MPISSLASIGWQDWVKLSLTTTSCGWSSHAMTLGHAFRALNTLTCMPPPIPLYDFRFKLTLSVKSSSIGPRIGGCHCTPTLCGPALRHPIQVRRYFLCSHRVAASPGVRPPDSITSIRCTRKCLAISLPTFSESKNRTLGG